MTGFETVTIERNDKTRWSLCTIVVFDGVRLCERVFRHTRREGFGGLFARFKISPHGTCRYGLPPTTRLEFPKINKLHACKIADYSRDQRWTDNARKLPRRVIEHVCTPSSFWSTVGGEDAFRSLNSSSETNENKKSFRPLPLRIE